MEYLEMMSRQLENLPFDPPNGHVTPYPCPKSALRYLHPQGVPKVNKYNLVKFKAQMSNMVNNYRSSSGHGPNPSDNIIIDQRAVIEPSTIVSHHEYAEGVTVDSDIERENEVLSEKKVRKRLPRKERKKILNALKSSSNDTTNNKEQSRSNSESNFKSFYPNYMPFVDVQKGLESGELFEGIIRINQKCTSEAYVPSPDKSKDILINSVKSRNRALEGDKVVVKILDKSEWRNPDTEEGQRTGEVVYILEKESNRIVIGHLLVDRGLNHRFSTLIPRDHRFPKLLVNTSTWPVPINLKEGTRESKELFYAILPNWDNFKIPMGNLKGVLGESGEIKAETEGILITHKIQENPYPKDIDKYFPLPFLVEEELKHRKDFRKHCIFSIDPPTAKDLDDALSCELLPNGNYEVGIHISDVSHFVKHGTPLDKIAEEVATSVYLVQKVYHMLPPALTMMASLLPGTDKLTVSVVLEMTPDAEIIKHSFCRSIIHSCAQLHYSHAQIFLENPEKKTWDDSEFPTVYNSYSINDCAKSVCHLHKLATVMRKRRFNTGALAINQPKLSFDIDRTTCEPLSYSLYILHESNWLIEEFMLLANTLVAEHLKTHFPSTALLRNHRPPDAGLMERSVKTLKLYGIDIDPSSAGSIHKSKAVYCQDDVLENRYRDIIINNILSKPMVRAEYCVMDSEKIMTHFALNVPYYTHFTSPIRRYPDIVVHRMLISWLTGTLIREYEDPKLIDNIAKNCNMKKDNAKKASESSAEIYAACLVGKLGSIVEDGSVMDVKENYFEATVLSMNMNVRVYVNMNPMNTDLCHEDCTYSIVDYKPTLIIVWDVKNDVKQSLQLFSKVKLKLMKKDNCRLKAVLVRND